MLNVIEKCRASGENSEKYSVMHSALNLAWLGSGMGEDVLVTGVMGTEFANSHS
jgi:hypothetical protein